MVWRDLQPALCREPEGEVRRSQQTLALHHLIESVRWNTTEILRNCVISLNCLHHDRNVELIRHQQHHMEITWKSPLFTFICFPFSKSYIENWNARINVSSSPTGVNISYIFALCSADFTVHVLYTWHYSSLSCLSPCRARSADYRFSGKFVRTSSGPPSRRSRLESVKLIISYSQYNINYLCHFLCI